MSKSVSNDALWEKLSEISEQLNSLSAAYKPQLLSSEQTENTPDLDRVKAGIIAEIEKQAKLLGMHSDINLKAVNQNIATLNENIIKLLSIVGRIRKQQKETVEELPKYDNKQQSDILEAQVKDNREYFSFRFFKLRKSSLAIAILGLLVFILTVFCMKQQNDYSLLMDEYYKQNVVLKGFEAEIDILRLH